MFLLQDLNSRDNDTIDDVGDDGKSLFQLKQNLIEEIKLFMKCRVKYSMKRLLSADLKTIYTNTLVTIEDMHKNYKNKLSKFLIDQHGHIGSNKSATISHNKGGFHHLFINYNW